MAWTTPKTYAANDILTAADMNTYQRDNLSWLGTDRFRASGVRSTSLSVTDNTITAVTLPDTEDFDTGAMHDVTTNSERLTVPTGGDGLYLVLGGVAWAANSAGRRILSLLVNGVAVAGVGATTNPDPGGSTVQRFSHLVELVAGDYLHMTGQQTSGGALNLTNARLQAIWMTT